MTWHIIKNINDSFLVFMSLNDICFLLYNVDTFCGAYITEKNVIDVHLCHVMLMTQSLLCRPLQINDYPKMTMFCSYTDVQATTYSMHT